MPHRAELACCSPQPCPGPFLTWRSSSWFSYTDVQLWRQKQSCILFLIHKEQVVVWSRSSFPLHFLIGSLFLIVRPFFYRMSLKNSIQVHSNSSNNPWGKALLSILYSKKQAQRGGVTCPRLCSGSHWNLDSGCSKEERIWLHVSCFFYFNPCILLFLLQVKNVTYSLKYTEEHIVKISHIFHSYRDKKFYNRE